MRFNRPTALLCFAMLACGLRLLGQEAAKPGDPEAPKPAVESTEKPAAGNKSAAAEKTPFVASLLLIKADWTKVPAAKEIEAELRAALKDASIPQELLDELPGSGPQILFAPGFAGLYESEPLAQLFSWLKAKELIEKVEPFDAARKPEATAGQGTLESPPTFFSMLRKSGDFIELPPLPEISSQPFVNRRPELSWEVDWTQGKPRFDVLRKLWIMEQVRGQKESATETLETTTWGFSLTDKQGALMNAFPAQGEGSLRKAGRKKGFEAVLFVARSDVHAKLHSAEPQLRLPHQVVPLGARHSWDYLPSAGGRRGERGDTSGGVAATEGGKGPPATKPEATAGNTDNLLATAEKTPFVASMLLIKADWTKAPAAKEIEAELRAALKDASIPQELLDKLPGSGPQILFAEGLAGLYQGEELAQFLSWLKAKGLIEKTEPFDLPLKGPDRDAAGSPHMPNFITVMRKPLDFVDLPPLLRIDTKPFVSSRRELVWQLTSPQIGTSLSIKREISVVSKQRGSETESRSAVDSNSFRFSLPPDRAALLNAFPAKDEDLFREAAHKKGFEAVLLVARGDAHVKLYAAEPRLHLPEQVITFTNQQRTNGSWAATSGGWGGGRRGTSGGVAATGGGKGPPATKPESVEGSADKAPTPAEAEFMVKIFHLQNAKAATLAGLIKQLFPKVQLNVAAEERTNSVIVNGPPEALDIVEAILLRFDESTKHDAAPSKNAAEASRQRSESKTPQSLADTWVSEEWGTVEFEDEKRGEYLAHYSAGPGGTAGTLTLTWSTEQTRFEGVWSDGKDRFGVLNLGFMIDGTIRGSYFNDYKSKAPSTKGGRSFRLQRKVDVPREKALPGTGQSETVPADGKSPTAKYQAAEKAAAEAAKELREIELARNNVNRSGPQEYQDRLFGKSEEQLNELRAALRAKVAVAFEARQELLKAELLEIESRLREVRESIDLRHKISDQIIDRRVGDLLDSNRRAEAARGGDEKTKRRLANDKLELLRAEREQRLKQGSPDSAQIKQIELQWISGLEELIKTYPDLPNSGDLMREIAYSKEWTGNDKLADAWYARIVEQFPDTPFAKKAAGARKRLALVGKAIELKGKTLDGEDVDLATYRGKMVVVFYWSSKFPSFKDDLNALTRMQDRFKGKPLQLVGVNLDGDVERAREYQKTNPTPWPQLFEPGDREGRFATEMGIWSPLLTMLIDEEGTVVSRQIRHDQLVIELQKRFGTQTSGRKPKSSSATIDPPLRVEFNGAAIGTPEMLRKNIEEAEQNLRAVNLTATGSEHEQQTLPAATEADLAKNFPGTWEALVRARRRLQFSREQLATQIRLLTQERESARAELAGASDDVKLAEALVKAGEAPLTILIAARQTMQRAKLRVEQSETLLELYEKISPPLVSPPAVPGNERPSADSAAKILSDELGISVEPAAAKDVANTRFRGGLRITVVRPDTPAARENIREGDILVGLAVWGTTSPESAVYALQHAPPDGPLPEKAPGRLKFYVLRDGETLFGHLNLPGK